MTSPLDALGLTSPVLAAPMAGGPGTPALAAAAAAAGGLGFLAGGYQSAADLAAQIAELRRHTPAFGVNLFAPGPVPADPAAFRAYAARLRPDADVYGLDLAGARLTEDDDGWAAKLDLLLADPVPVASFTFALPPPSALAALRAAGTVVVQTVTSAGEAWLADEAGADLLAVQSAAAGGHWGTFTPGHVPAEALPLPELTAAVAAVTRRPLIAAGGIAGPDDAAAALAAGAIAVMAGTMLLRSQEAGTSAVHRAALARHGGGGTVVTRAFTGRPARALPNGFTARHGGHAPLGYPAIHHLTSPLRKAAAAAGDAGRVHLWAGTGCRHATDEPAAAILTRLARRA